MLMIAWVLFVADFVKKLVYERELRLHEVICSSDNNNNNNNNKVMDPRQPFKRLILLCPRALKDSVTTCELSA